MFFHLGLSKQSICRRKTINLPYECMLFFDYNSGNIVSCNFSNSNSPNKVKGKLYTYLLKMMHMASIHNHPIQYGSFPSGKNFEMLGLEFEEFELIVSINEMWILESHEEIFSTQEINKIRSKLDYYQDSIFFDINSEFKEDYMVIGDYM